MASTNSTAISDRSANDFYDRLFETIAAFCRQQKTRCSLFDQQVVIEGRSFSINSLIVFGANFNESGSYSIPLDSRQEVASIIMSKVFETLDREFFYKSIIDFQTPVENADPGQKRLKMYWQCRHFPPQVSKDLRNVLSRVSSTFLIFSGRFDLLLSMREQARFAHLLAIQSSITHDPRVFDLLEKTLPSLYENFSLSVQSPVMRQYTLYLAKAGAGVLQLFEGILNRAKATPNCLDDEEGATSSSVTGNANLSSAGSGSCAYDFDEHDGDPFDDWSPSSSAYPAYNYEEVIINPATGDFMVGGYGGVDTSGHFYGMGD